MVSAAASTRAAKVEEVLATCAELCANFDGLTDAEQKGTKYPTTTRQGTYQNQVLTICKGEIPGFTLDHHKAFRDNITTNVPKMNSEVKLTELESVDGNRVLHQQIKMPIMMSNRSVINMLHLIEKDDGTVIFLNTSQGNEDLIEKYKDKIGKDVVALNYFNYTVLKPIEGGMDITIATCLDPMGSIPDFLKKQGASRMIGNGEKMIHFMMTGEVMK